MTRTTLVSIIGLAVALTMLLGCAATSLAVREGMLREVLLWFPPDGRYQLIVRIGNDAAPWDTRGGRPAAINMWVHDRRRTEWHVINVVRVPLGGKPSPERDPYLNGTATIPGGP